MRIDGWTDMSLFVLLQTRQKSKIHLAVTVLRKVGVAVVYRVVVCVM
jgi:hypothetical protein